MALPGKHHLAISSLFVSGYTDIVPRATQTVNADKYVVRTALLEGADKFNVAAEVYMKEKFKFQPQIAETAFETVPPS